MKNLAGNEMLSLFTKYSSVLKRKIAEKYITKSSISDSSAITEKGQYALDATEKNASINGTLANQIGALDSKLSNKLDAVNSIEIVNANPQVTVISNGCIKNGHILFIYADINVSVDYETNTDLIYLPLNIISGFAIVKNTYYPENINNKNVLIYNSDSGFKVSTQEAFPAGYYTIIGIGLV